jgi:hypothetical protein
MNKRIVNVTESDEIRQLFALQKGFRCANL